MQKIIPPFLFLCCIITMICLHQFLPLQQLIEYPFNLIGMLFFGLGLLMVTTISKRFSKVKTEIHTFKKPRKLVKGGLFQYTRNPIYLGFVTALLGIAILLGSAAAFIPIICFFLAANFWYIPFEEKNMKAIFGQDYHFYQRNVRRWL